MTYVPANLSIWQGRADSLPGERFFQRVKPLDLANAEFCEAPAYALLGFACDEGVRRNLGRVGAALGPQAFRTQFGKLACHKPNSWVFYDAGDISCDHDLAKAQNELGQAVKKLRALNYLPILIGGGHEIAFGHYLGLEEKDLAIINFDAHFDLRPTSKAMKESSGTPFRQIAERRKLEGLDFDYTVIGVQKTSNTRSLFEAAQELKVVSVFADDIHQDLTAAIKQVADLVAHKKAIYLTICLDVIAENFAPGVSAPQIFGLSPWQVAQLLKPIVASNRIISFDIAELSPPHDENHRTARLAAELVTKIAY